MNTKSLAVVSSTLVALSIGMSVASDISHRRRMKRFTLIQNETIRPAGVNYLELHDAFLQDPRVKDSMRLIDLTDPNIPEE